MPRYTIQAPDGRTVTVEGDKPPTDADLDGIFSALPVKAAPAAAPTPEQPGLLQQVGSAISSAAGGFAKELPLVGLRAAMLPQQIANGIVDKGAEMVGVPLAARLQAAQNAPQQAIQGTLEQQPGAGMAERAGRIGARAVPSVALGALTGGLSLGPGAVGTAGTLATQGMLQGALGAAQSDKSSVDGVAVDAGSAGAGAMLGTIASKAIPAIGRFAVKEYIKALAPTKEATKAVAQKIAPELLKRGVSGSLGALEAQGRAGANVTGTALSDAYEAATKAGTTVDATQIAAGLDALKKPFLAKGPTGDPIVLHQGAVDAIENIQNTLREFGDKASPEQLWKFRKVLDDVVQASNGFTRPMAPPTATALTRSVRGAMQDALTKAVPGVKGLNSDFALWKGLADVAGASVKRKAGQSGIVGDVLRSSAAGALGSLAAGHAGVAAAAVPYLYTRPLVRTAAAVALNRFGPAAAQLGQVAGPAMGMSLADLLSRGQEQ